MVEAGIIDPAKVTKGALRERGHHRGDGPHHRGADHRHPRGGTGSGDAPGGGGMY